jgi:hypothetical protein
MSFLYFLSDFVIINLKSVFTGVFLDWITRSAGVRGGLPADAERDNPAC